MVFECFVAVYAGWSAQAWVVAIVAGAMMPAMVSIPFWMRRDRGFGIAAILFFVALVSIYGLAECAPSPPTWVGVAIALACLTLVCMAYVLAIHGPRNRVAPDGGA